MSLPQVVSREQWLAARKELLAREKELTKARGALNADRRRLSMVRIDKTYTFQGPAGTATLADLFDGRRQLVVQHVMFDPAWDEAWKGCTASIDELPAGPDRARQLARHQLPAGLPCPAGQDRELPAGAGLDAAVALVAGQ